MVIVSWSCKVVFFVQLIGTVLQVKNNLELIVSADSMLSSSSSSFLKLISKKHVSCLRLRYEVPTKTPAIPVRFPPEEGQDQGKNLSRLRSASKKEKKNTKSCVLLLLLLLFLKTNFQKLCQLPQAKVCGFGQNPGHPCSVSVGGRMRLGLKPVLLKISIKKIKSNLWQEQD